MLIEVVKLGFKDIIKFRLYFILLEVLILSISIVFISSSSSLIYALSDKGYQGNIYSVTPINYDFSNQKNIEMQLNEVFDEGGYTFFYSEKLNNKFRSQILVIFGRYDNDSNIKEIWCIPENQKSMLLDKEIGKAEALSLNSLDISKLEKMGVNSMFYGEEMSFVSVSDRNYSKLSDYGLSINELIFLIENTQFTEEDVSKKLDNVFENIFQDKSLHLTKNITPMDKEVDFLLKYILIFILFLMCSLFFSYLIIITSLLNHLTKEYVIHLICGSTRKNIFIRNSVFVCLLSGINFMLINLLNNFNLDMFFFINLSLFFFFMFSLLLSTMFSLKRIRLNLTSQGE
ncbi:hypothetical protein [Fundicoccus ignavus]|uniref:DUF1430 domain-containing protein n=1 Tax=Fundicoccus ignavus TaxID=2664442 RepID=A0A844C2Q2_9LACT|nr:hypothetical protein [Fundicoccus ignavus]MRJ48499.1 hypothetical protein [Fundicoccus ignavus]